MAKKSEALQLQKSRQNHELIMYLAKNPVVQIVGGIVAIELLQSTPGLSKGHALVGETAGTFAEIGLVGGIIAQQLGPEGIKALTYAATPLVQAGVGAVGKVATTAGLLA